MDTRHIVGLLGLLEKGRNGMALSSGEPDHRVATALAWEQADNWLQNRDYQTLASWILDAQRVAQQQGDKGLLHLLTAVYQVCLQCKTYKKEVYLV